MYQTNEELTEKAILNVVRDYEGKEKPRIDKLVNYYLNENTEIHKRKMAEGKPNNRISNGYASYIVDMFQGYFLGKPVTYTASEENQDMMEFVQDIFDHNDEQDVNSENAKNMGIAGVAHEIVYLDEDGDFHFTYVPPGEMIVIYDTSIKEKMRMAIRKYDIGGLGVGQDETYLEVYTDSEIIRYSTTMNTMKEIERIDHFFGEVPVIEYRNNSDMKGDFERVIDEIDAYNRAVSNKINDLDYFTDAYLYLVGMTGTTAEDLQSMRESRVILLEEEGEAGFLTKDSNTNETEAVKNRLNNDIHKFSNVVDLSDENFAANSSGVAMAYKLFGMEQVTSNKERKFKKGLQKRLRLLTTFLNLKGNDFDYRDIALTFTRNKPVNEKEAVEVAAMLMGITSEQTALSYLPMVDDPLEEKERKSQDIDPYEEEGDRFAGEGLDEEVPDINEED